MEWIKNLASKYDLDEKICDEIIENNKNMITNEQMEAKILQEKYKISMENLLSNAGAKNIKAVLALMPSDDLDIDAIPENMEKVIRENPYLFETKSHETYAPALGKQNICEHSMSDQEYFAYLIKKQV